MAWNLTYLNIPGVYMATLFAILQIMSVCILSNLSKIYDLKMETAEGVVNEDANVESTPGRIEENSGSIHALKRMLTNFDIVFLLSLTFFEYYLSMCIMSWLPIMVVDKLHWSINTVGIIHIGIGIFSLILCIFFMCYPISNKFLFCIAVLALPAVVMVQLIFTVMFHYNKNFILNIFLWIIFCTMYIFIAAVEEVFLVSTLARMVSSKYQVFADGFRLTLFRMGGVVAFSTSPLIFDKMDIVSYIHISVIMVFLVILIIRRESFKHPTIVIS